MKKQLIIFLYEWKHFARSPFKIIAILLFVLACVYGLHNGAALYNSQNAEIAAISERIEEQKESTLAQYEKGQYSPEGRPWIDLTTPFWAIRNVPAYHFKNPSPAIVYSTGQAEQYGFYKRITVWATPYDADLAEEIANPERLQYGTLDFAFVLLYLLPLLLLILLYNIKSAEREQGILSLIYVQVASKNVWLLLRISFYFTLLAIILLILIFYGASITNVFETHPEAFGTMLFYALLYLLLWTILFYFILQNGNTILGNTLKMTGLWLLFSFIIPATKQQIVSISEPVNLMTDFIDVMRDGRERLFEQPDSVLDNQLFNLYPGLSATKLYQDSLERNRLRRFSASALVKEMVQKESQAIIQESQARNNLINKSLWFNPVTFFQNRINRISSTHFNDYEQFRNEIELLIDKQIGTLILDMWDDVNVDETKFLEYYENLSKL